MIEKYEIKDITEESDCDYCGWPLDTGDTAYLVDETFVVCCKEHADDIRPRKTV